jgi:hypothetical protein
LSLTANKLHSFPQTYVVPSWKHAIKLLEDEFSVAKHPRGVAERPLLDFFGASVENIALLVFGLHGVMPTYVAREFELGHFRSDFAWIALDDQSKPLVGFIELEPALEDTLFKTSRSRNAPYLGDRFLGGFGQLVDWCAFGRGEAALDPKISPLLGANGYQAIYLYGLVAGLDRFALDRLSHNRLTWWQQNIAIGNGTCFKTFSQLLLDADNKIRWNAYLSNP